MTAPELNPGDWLTVNEVAAWLGVSRKTVLRRIESGDLAAIRLSEPRGHLRISTYAALTYTLEREMNQ